MSARLHRTSTVQYFSHACSVHLELPISIPPRLPTARLKSSQLLPPRLHACSAPPEFYTLYLHRHISRLQSSIPPRLHAYSTPLELPSFIPLRLHTCSAPLEPGARYLHVCTPAARLQSSRAPHLHVHTPAAHLRRVIPLHLRACSLAPYLRTSASLRAMVLELKSTRL